MLYTVLKNLIENAALHAQTDIITIKMQDSSLFIQDNGKTLSEHELKHLGQRSGEDLRTTRTWAGTIFG